MLSYLGKPCKFVPHAQDSAEYFQPQPTVILGRGSNGLIIKANHRNRPAAAKTSHMLRDPAVYGLYPETNDNLPERAHQVCDFVSEAEMLSRLRHPNIVELYGLCYVRSTGMPKWIVMEYLPRSLEGLMENHEVHAHFDQWVVASIMADVAAGLAYLHDEVSQSFFLEMSMEMRCCF